MDNLTHSLVGALLRQAGLKRKTGLAMPALIIGANLPDVDAACFFWLEGIEHLGFRRGITHGPPALVLLPLVLAGLLWGFDRWQAKRGTRPEGRLPVSFKWLFLLSFIGCLTHPTLDWLNVYGIRLLEPFSSEWFYGDTLFIIDVWLWALMGFATWFSLMREKRAENWTRPARLAIGVALVYIAGNGVFSAYVRDMARLHEPYPVYAIAAPVPFAFWERETIILREDGIWLSTHWTGPDEGRGYHEAGTQVCALPKMIRHIAKDGELAAFLFWSRAPFAEQTKDGSVILRDARFYDPRARDRFAIAVPNASCEEPLDDQGS